MKVKNFITVLMTMFFVLAVVFVYVVFFDLKNSKELIFAILPIAPSLLLLMAVDRFGDFVYNNVTGIDKFITNVLIFLKLACYILVCHTIVNLFSSHWAWWMFSIVVGALVLLVDFFSYFLREGNT